MLASKPVIVPELPSEATAQVIPGASVAELLALMAELNAEPDPPICKLILKNVLFSVIDSAVQSSVIVVPGLRVTVIPAIID